MNSVNAKDIIPDDMDIIEALCPQCGMSSFAGFKKYIDAQKNPEAVPEIISGSLFEYVCPHCEYEAHLNNPFLFIDRFEHVYVYSILSEEMKEHAEDALGILRSKDTAESVCRVVVGRKELEEKVLALTNKIDDRSLELVKRGVRENMKKKCIVTEANDAIVRLEALDEDTLSFDIAVNEDSYYADIDINVYNFFRNALAASSIANDQPLYVNATWSEYALEMIKKEGLLD